MNINKLIISTALLTTGSLLFARDLKLKDEDYEIQFSDNGVITSFLSEGRAVEFRKDNTYEGQSNILSGNKVELHNTSSNPGNLIFSGETSKIAVNLSYYFEDKAFVICTTVKN